MRSAVVKADFEEIFVGKPQTEGSVSLTLAMKQDSAPSWSTRGQRCTGDRRIQQSGYVKSLGPTSLKYTLQYTACSSG